MRLGRLLRLALSAALGTAALFAADSFVFVPVPKAVVEERVQAYSTKPLERRDGLRRLFEEAGCVAPSLTEQAVKHEPLGNVICTLPGLTDSKIVVGAHYDHLQVGAGVIDNWSGASLLASLYQSLASRPDAELVRTLCVVAKVMELPVAGVNVERVGSSDGQSFRLRKIPSIDIHSVGSSPVIYTIWI